MAFAIQSRDPLPAGFPGSAAAPGREAGQDVGWLLTLSDLTLILLCFFIVLNVADRRRHARAAAAAAERAAAEEAAAENSQTADRDEPARAEALPPALTISFAPKISEVRRDMFAVLDEAAAVLSRRPELGLELVGHTDDRPIATTEFPSNWELAAARAGGAARYLIQKGVDPARLTVESYAAFRPALPNSNAQRRDANRRVEMRFYPMPIAADGNAAGPAEEIIEANTNGGTPPGKP